MAEALFLVTKSQQGGEKLINGVRAVVVNDDDAESAALHIASAVAACNRAFPKDAAGSDPFPAGYFDTVVTLSDLTTGPIPDDADAVVFSERQVIITEA